MGVHRHITAPACGLHRPGAPHDGGAGRRL